MDPQQQLANLLMPFLNARSWAESKRLVKANPLLLTKEADALLARLMVAYSDDKQATRILVERRNLLAHCRAEGIEVAFAHHLRTAPTELEIILHELNQSAQPNDYPRRLELCRRALALVSRESNPQLWAALQGTFGIDLSQTASGSRTDNLEQAIVAFQHALEFFTPQDTPVEWAQTMNNLGNAYAKRMIGEQATNLEQAIDCYQQALSVRTRQTMPKQWAATINNLALVYTSRIRGSQAKNLEQAIDYYQQALEVRTRQAMPLDWAQTMNNLANAYARRVRGEQAENLEQAIAHYQQALEVRTHQLVPLDWATTMNNLGEAYRKRIRGNRAHNYEQAIYLYEQALQVTTRQAMPVEWADTMNNLGLAYQDRIQGERAGNLEQAIAYLEQVLEVRTRQAMPVAWAQTMNNLGLAYQNRIRGERAENLEQAIAAYEQALEVRTHQAMPIEWADMMNNLGLAYEYRIRGDRAENLEQAIYYHQQALEVRSRQAMPIRWADTMNNLANVYAKRIRGDQAKNLEQAIAAYKQVLALVSRQTEPIVWAETMNNLGEAYRKRIQGDRAENLEQAIAAYEQAQKVLSRETNPIVWAETMNNLANAYYSRIRGTRAANIEQAITAYEQVLEVRTEQAMPVAWAETMNNLAVAYESRLQGDRAENLEQAIVFYQQALKVRTRQALPLDWATTMYNLAAALTNRYKGDQEQNLEQAIDAFQQVLSLFTRQATPLDWAHTINGLALAYRDRIRGERSANLEQAIVYLKQALEVQTLTALPDEHRRNQRNLGGLYFDERRWAEAYTAYAAALQASELLYQASSTPEARQAELRENLDLPARAAYSLARLGRLTEAATTLEQGKARALGEALARHEAALDAASSNDRAAFTQERERIAALEAEARATRQPKSRDFLAISTDLRQAREKLAAIVARIRQTVPQFMPVGLSFAAITSVADALAQPLVYLLMSPAGTLALIIPPKVTALTDEHLVWLNQWRTNDLADILSDREGKRGYLYGTVLADTDTLKRVLDEAWPKLSNNLMSPIAAHLRQLGHQQAVLIPSGPLSLLPLHAISSEEVIFTLAPSARALQTAASAAKKRTRLSPVLLGIGNPLPNPKPLPFARLEVEEISPLFATAHTFYEEAATSKAVRSRAATHLHFSCHGTFNVQQPLNSALYLAFDDLLTLRDLLDGQLDLSTARLAVLSACQTGITDFQNVPDEAIGFPAGFLQAGVPGVISTLWPVTDISTALLLARFYRYHLSDGLTPALALHKAQCWLRQATTKELKLADYYQQLVQKAGQREERAKAFVAMRHYQAYPNSKPFEHPYYWAALTFSGV